MIASSGSPFNITTTNDLNDDSIFNDRPGFVSTVTCPTTVNTPPSTTYCTPLGTFNAQPSVSDKITPVNYGTGPSQFTLNLRLTKTFGFGRKTGDLSNSGHGGTGNGGGGSRGVVGVHELPYSVAGRAERQVFPRAATISLSVSWRAML
jgi:hypothetical protein